MKLTGIVRAFDSALEWVCAALSTFGGAVLALLMFFTFVDVLLRYAFSTPITGDYDISSFMMAMVIPSGLAICALKREHIRVDILTVRLPERVQAGLSIFGELLTLAFVGLMVWQGGKHASILIESGTRAQAIAIPIYPFVIVMTIGLAVFFLVTVRNISLDAQKVTGGAQ